MTKVRQRRISSDMGKVKELLENVPEDKRAFAHLLYNELSFMQKTMTGLKEQVNNEGAVDLFEQGKQKFLREHPALKAYNTTVQRYSLLFKQLVDLLPKDDVDVQDELIDFINGK